jgi:hypothetical protein
MILPFKNYLDNKDAEEQRSDAEQARFLMDKAGRRLLYIKQRAADDTNADFIFEDAYDCMREAGHAIMALRGYKPLTHEVVVAFLRDEEELEPAIIQRLDSYRKLRNKSVYAARKFGVNTAKEATAFAEELISILRPRIK